MKIKKCFISCSEMPNSCEECKLCSIRVIPYGYLIPCGSSYCLLDADIDTNHYNRPSGCPLVAIDTDVPDMNVEKSENVVEGEK